ncbi:hypothetical protein TWF718_001013 [Orbilia javanica]|uniref:PHD-type domain-containing protein n=1 Tax=Orbilia javanica TaxID=47235 RepID=A0AAN8N0N2_9PEZI
MAAAAAVSVPRIKLHFSANAHPPPPVVSGGESDEDEEVMESEEPESSGGDDGDVDSLEEYPISPTVATKPTGGFDDEMILNAEPSLPFRPVRIILKAPKRNPEEEEEEEVAAFAPVRKKRKRRKSKTNHRRYDSSTSSEEYIQSGFKTLSGRTVINPNTRKDPSPPPPKDLSPQNSNSKSKVIAMPRFRFYTPSNPIGRSHRASVSKLTEKDDDEEAIRLSILNARCVKCHKASDSKGDKIVFCDGCERPYHQMCHRPKIDQSYIEFLEKNWFCFECAELSEEEDYDEESFEEMDVYQESDELIGRIQAEQENDGSLLRDVDMASEGYEGSIQEDDEDELSTNTLADITSPLTNISPQNMEDSIKDLDEEQHELFLNTLTHKDLVDLICRLRASGATFDFNFPSGIKEKLLEFTRAQNEKGKGKKRKSSATATAEAPKEPESVQADEPALSSTEEEDSDGENPPEFKRRKLTAAERYWMWRDDPEIPSVTNIVFRDGVGRPAHEVYPPLFPFPGREQKTVSQPKEDENQT